MILRRVDDDYSSGRFTRSRALTCCALVAKTWTTPAQKELWDEISLVGSSREIAEFFVSETKELDFPTRSLTLHDVSTQEATLALYHTRSLEEWSIWTRELDDAEEDEAELLSLQVFKHSSLSGAELPYSVRFLLDWSLIYSYFPLGLKRLVLWGFSPMFDVTDTGSLSLPQFALTHLEIQVANGACIPVNLLRALLQSTVTSLSLGFSADVAGPESIGEDWLALLESRASSVLELVLIEFSEAEDVRLGLDREAAQARNFVPASKLSVGYGWIF